jgi:hypothetical protein
MNRTALRFFRRRSSWRSSPVRIRRLPATANRWRLQQTVQQTVQVKYTGPHDVTLSCQGAHLSRAVKGFGNLDGVGQLQAGKSEPEANGFVADRAGTIALGGWVADLPNKTPALAACLVIDGKLEPRAFALYGIGRPDVAASLHGDGLLPTGFNLTLPVSDLRRGFHRVSVAVVLASGETDSIPSGFSVRVP